MANMFDYKSFKKYGANFRPTGGEDYKTAIKRGKDVVGELGSSKAPKGYYQSGTTKLENMRGGKSKTYAIYSKLPTKQESSKPKPQQQQNRDQPSSARSNLGTEMGESYWQNQITKLMGTITSQQQAARDAAAAQQAAFDQRLADLTSGFDTKTAQLTSGFQSQMEAANAARQQEIEGIMAANTEQMGMLQTQQQERIQAMEASQAKLMAEQEARVQQMQIAQQTQAANAARAGQTGQFRFGGDRAVGGIGQFKRRLQIKPVASGALSLAGSPNRSSNKMLNV